MEGFVTGVSQITPTLDRQTTGNFPAAVFTCLHFQPTRTEKFPPVPCCVRTDMCRIMEDFNLMVERIKSALVEPAFVGDITALT